MRHSAGGIQDPSLGANQSAQTTLLQQIEDNTDGLEGLTTSTNTKLDTLIGQTDAVEGSLSTISTNQTSGGQKTQLSTPAPVTVKQQAISVGTTAVRLTTDGAVPSATRVVLMGQPDPNSSANFWVGSSTVANSGANRGPALAAGEKFIANNDAGDYYIISDTAAQTVFVMEQE